MMHLTLHAYWRSSASFRVRIALALKELAYAYVGHDLRIGGYGHRAWRQCRRKKTQCCCW